MSKLNLGHCGICETEIWRIEGKRQVANENYSEFWISLSSDSIAKHAICRNCKLNLTRQKVVTLFERIKETWADEMVGWATDAQFARMRSQEVLDWEQDERSITTNHKMAMRLYRQKKLDSQTRIKNAIIV